MERKSFLASAGVLAAGAALGAPALARGDVTSDNNLIAIRSRLESYIDQLRRDQRDYGGHRANAITWLQRAVNELTVAVRYDQTHG